MVTQTKKVTTAKKATVSANKKTKPATYAPIQVKSAPQAPASHGIDLLETISDIIGSNKHSNIKIEAHTHVDGFSIAVTTNQQPDLELPFTDSDDQIWPELRQTLSTPLPGQYWEGQGGYYAGLMVDGNQLWYIILSDAKHELDSLTWGKSSNEIKGDFSRRDGRKNTALILAAEPDNKAAQHVTALLIDGHKDFYWPAQHELDQINITCPHLMGTKQYWSSTQYSALTAWLQDFENGYTLIDLKDYKRAVRAVRRISANSSIK
jgi:hypothetical protein